MGDALEVTRVYQGVSLKQSKLMAAGVLLGLALGISGCSNDPAEPKTSPSAEAPVATTNTTQATTAAAPTQQATSSAPATSQTTSAEATARGGSRIGGGAVKATLDGEPVAFDPDVQANCVIVSDSVTFSATDTRGNTVGALIRKDSVYSVAITLANGEKTLAYTDRTGGSATATRTGDTWKISGEGQLVVGGTPLVKPFELEFTCK